MLCIKIKYDTYSVPKKLHKAKISHQCAKCKNLIKPGEQYRKGTIIQVVNGYRFYYHKLFCINCCDKEERKHEH